MLSIPLPYISNEAGWIVAEVGRQPWIVYGLMKTSDAASTLVSSHVAVTLVGFLVVYGLLGLAGFYMMARNAIKGPAPAHAESKQA